VKLECKIRTKQVANCPEVEAPVQVIFYQSRAGFVGSDTLTYEVKNAAG
jgi:hypothetical protein